MNSFICLMCDSEVESASHLFLHCTFARAIWCGSTLEIRTIELNTYSVKQWIWNYINTNSITESAKMDLLQAVFTTLWLIWNHRNVVLHKGKVPMPLEVVLMFQSLICRCREAFQTHQDQRQIYKPKPSIFMLTQNWQVLIEVAASRNRRTKRCGFAFEARRMDGALLFRGGTSCGRPIQHLAAQEALVETLIKSTAMDLFKAILVSNDQRRAELCNNQRKATWQDQALAMDLQNLHQQGLITHFLLVPNVVIGQVLYLAGKPHSSLSDASSNMCLLMTNPCSLIKLCSF